MNARRICALSFLVMLMLAASYATARAQTDNPGQALAPPDVTGRWHTRHSFDISAALPLEIENGFAPLRTLDDSIVSQLNLPRRDQWLEPIIGRQIKQYIPPWVQTIVRIGDDIGVILGTLRSEGAMDLGKGVDDQHVKGSEVWTSLTFYWLPLCGDKIGGDPGLPPECARFDIATTDNDIPNETPRVRGQVIPTLAAPNQDPVWQLVIDRRRIRLRMGKVVLAAINELIGRTTPWHSIDEATDCSGGSCVVDCPGLAASLANYGPDVTVRVEAACVVAVRKAGRETMRGLSRSFADAAVLEFDGWATVFGAAKDDLCLSNTGCAAMLGLPEYNLLLKKDPAHRDGLWEGSFFSKTLKNMPGAWHATRDPVR